MPTLTLYWHCTDAALTLYWLWHCADTMIILILHQYCTNAELIILQEKIWQELEPIVLNRWIELFIVVLPVVRLVRSERLESPCKTCNKVKLQNYKCIAITGKIGQGIKTKFGQNLSPMSSIIIIEATMKTRFQKKNRNQSKTPILSSLRFKKVLIRIDRSIYGSNSLLCPKIWEWRPDVARVNLL